LTDSCYIEDNYLILGVAKRGNYFFCERSRSK